MTRSEQNIYTGIPTQINPTQVLALVHAGTVTSKYMNVLKAVSAIADDVISEWLNINVKTFRSYKSKNVKIKEDLQEHTLMLLSLMKHGAEVFGTADNFNTWLDTDNFYLNWKKPNIYLNTISGIQFIDDQLTGMEYGDNA